MDNTQYNHIPFILYTKEEARDRKEDLKLLARSGLDQIKEKQVEREMRSAGVNTVLCMGIAFRGKEVAVHSSALQKDKTF